MSQFKGGGIPPFFMFTCITDIISIRNICDADESGVVYFLDDLGISLSTAAKIADERYITGTELVNNKIAQACQDVIDELTINVVDDCDIEECVCDNASKIARAAWYRAAALIYKELIIDSKRFNDIIKYGEADAGNNMLYYDDSLIGIYAAKFGMPQTVVKGQYQLQLEKLESIKLFIERICTPECVGARYQINLP